MANRKSPPTREEIRINEKGESTPTGSYLVALGYPAGYGVAASSLGYQTTYRALNAYSAICCERFFYHREASSVPVTLESGRAVGDAVAIGFSVACETDLLPVVDLLQRAGVSPLAAERGERAPLVVIGGPLTLLDARLVSPLADVVVCGEGEEAIASIASVLIANPSKRNVLDALTHAGKGIWLPSLDASHASPPAPHFVPASCLPAYAATWSPLADFKDLFLVEIARGCPRRCAFCLLAKSGRFRAVDKETVWACIPESAAGVGLVGAAVTDHPALEELVAHIVASGRRVSLSSMRADRLTPELLHHLAKGGLRTLTVAADGASEQIRAETKKGITEQHLFDAVAMARNENLKGMKLYSMVGLPGETEADVDEFSRLVLELAKQIRLTVAIQSFVPKPNTPLADVSMLSEKELKQRLNRFTRAMKGKVTIQSTSPRWSWIDWKLAHGKERSVLVATEALALGGDFAAWKRAIALNLS